MEKLYNAKEVSGFLGNIGASQVRQLAKSMGVGAKWKDRYWVFTADDIEKLAKRPNKSIGSGKRRRRGRQEAGE